MDKSVLYKTISSDGIYTCGDIGISMEEWTFYHKKEQAAP